MATFNVFVEGPVDDSPMGLPELADAMSERYGIPAADLVARLKRGRFRVKSNLDAASADRYRKDLESIGARVLVENSTLSPTATPVAGTPVLRPSGLSIPPATARAPTPPPTRAATPAHGSTTPPPNRPTPPPSALAGYARPSTPPPMAAHQRPSTPIPNDMVSGLSAGFGDSAQADLGALGDGSLSLASLDGEAAPAASNQFDTAPLPEEEKAAVSFAPPKPKPKAPETPRKKPGPSKPMDLFAPPDAGDQDLVVDFATEEKEDRAAKRATAPPETAPAATTRRTPVSVDVPTLGTSAPPRPFSRGNFIAAIVVALAVGFVPAHVVANMREKSAFAAIDGQVAAAYATADSPETYEALDGARESFLDDKQGKRTMIALTSMLLWAVISAGVAFALLRYTPKPKS